MSGDHGRCISYELQWKNAPKERGCSLCAHEEHAKHLADAGEATRVDLADAYRIRLEQLLEHHPVMSVLAVVMPIPCGFSARRIAACPRMSSGAVGSSMNLTKGAQVSVSPHICASTHEMKA